MKKILLIMFVCILLVGSVSALDILPIKQYDEDTLTITIVNFINLGRDIVDIKLNTPLVYVVPAGYQKVAELEIDLFDDTYTDAFNDMEFYDLNNDEEKIERDFDYKLWGKEEYVVNDYKETCDDYINKINCKLTVIGTHIEERDAWIDFDYSELSKGKYIIGVFTQVNIGDNVEWIPTLFGKEIDEWAIYIQSSGTKTYQDIGGENYTTETFTSNGYFNVTGDTLNVSVLVVAGGGGGGNGYGGGGGGAGGLIWNNAYDVPLGNYNVFVGLGGDGGATGGSNDGISGGNSTFNDIIAVGGGGGGAYEDGNGLYGGSAGGGSQVGGNGGVGTVGQGNNGGDGDSTGGGGGGGANAVGGDAPAGTGGNGLTYSIYNGTALYYAGGGGAGVSAGTGLGGLGGGGNGGVNAVSDGVDGVDGTGGGGGGSPQLSTYPTGDGGNGIIIIRYLTSDVGGLFPDITLNSPVDNYNSSTSTITFNGTVVLFSDRLIANVSLIIDGIYNETNTSGINNSYYYFTKIFSEGHHNWTYEVCNNESNCVNATTRDFLIDINFPVISLISPTRTFNYLIQGDTIYLAGFANDTNLNTCWYEYNGANNTFACTTETLFNESISATSESSLIFWVNDSVGNINSSIITWYYNVFETSRTLNLSTYQTQSETFSINITANSSLTAVTLDYNGTDYSTIKSGNIYSNTLDVPVIYGNKSLRWKFTYAGGTITSNDSYQYVNITQLGICNATLTVPYINFSFKDEETSLNMNATIDASTWSYWLGDGTYTKSLLFSNNSLNNNYAFCFSASNDTMHNTRSVQYAAPGYPQRKYDASSDLTNVTTNQTLYLLSSSDGIYTTIQVVDQEGDKIGDVEVTVERQFAGVWTVVGQEVTDDAGLVTFWVNPDYDHRLTFVSDDCVGETVTIRPTQTQYTQQLQCGASADIYVSQIEGIKYSRTPATGIVQAGTYNFSYQLVSSKDNIVNMSFQLVNASDGTVLNSTSSTCNVGGCTVYVMHTVDLGNDIKGKYYLDIGNGSFLLEGDARWRCIDIPTAGKAGMLTFIRDMKYVIDEWGDDSDTADFNRLVIVFFFMALAITVLNLNFGNDTQNPGAFLIIMFFVILLGSLSGSFVGGEMTGQGFFYFNNLTGNDFINNYILLGFTLVIMVSYFININRQASR